MTPADKTERTALIESLRSAYRHRAEVPPGGRRAAPAPAPAPGSGPAAFDFSTLPAAREISLHRAVGETLGIRSPFFRLHDGPPTAERIVEGAGRTSFASYNYLGLNGDPRVMRAAIEAVERHGVSATASRLVGGERPGHRSLETALAQALGTEDAVVMVSGHATNLTTIGTLLGKDDLILMDQFSHNSIAEGARLSGAHRLSFPHNDLDWLDDRLVRSRSRHRHALIAVEGLYSMDGDSPDLARLVEIKDRHAAWLMVDEAHALGVLGSTGRGLAEAQGIDPRRVEIWMGTLSKTLASCGGFIAGSRALVEILKTTGPGFVFSVGLAPPLAATAEAALERMLAEPERVARLRENGLRFLSAARAAGLDTGLSEGSAVTPVITGDSLSAAMLSDRLLDRGIDVMPIIHPAVPEKLARLRFFITAQHTDDQIDRAAAETAALLSEVRADLARADRRPG